jgi:hypothetical protein
VGRGRVEIEIPARQSESESIVKRDDRWYTFDAADRVVLMPATKHEGNCHKWLDLN